MARPPSRDCMSPADSARSFGTDNGSYHLEVLGPDSDVEVPTAILDKPLVSSPLNVDEDLRPSVSRRRLPSASGSRPTSARFIIEDPTNEDDVDISIRIQSPTVEGHTLPPSIRRSFLNSTDCLPQQIVIARPISRSRSPSAHRSHRRQSRIAVHSDDSSDDLSYYSAYRPKPRRSAKPWRKFVHKLKQHDDDMVKGWKEDIDTLLVYAGLFSAVLTAFIVESYQLLQQDSGQASATLLQLVVNHLLSNVAPSVVPTDTTPFQQSAFAIRINILWFSSLVFSLAAASVSILAKQWLRNYVSTIAGSPREAARIRQFRHAGLIEWHIPEIVAFLPVLLQFSLAFFFVGLLDLLWTLNDVVAGVITVFVSISLSFLVVTTILPTLSRSSPHHSPQALAVFRIAQVIKRLTAYILLKVSKPLELQSRPFPLYINFNLFSGSRRRRLHHWLQQQRHGRVLLNWREREKHIVRQHDEVLEHQLIAEADALFMDDKMLSKVIRPCISEVQSSTAVKCLIDILIQRAHGTEVDGEPKWLHHKTADRGMLTLLHLSADVLERIDPLVDGQTTVRVLGIFERLYKATTFDHDDPETVGLYRRIHETLPLYLAANDIVAQKAFKIIWDSQQASSCVMEVVLDAGGIERITDYAHKQREDNESRVFFEACTVALLYAANAVEYAHIRPLSDKVATVRAIRALIHTLMTALEAHLATTSATPSPSLVIALLDYIEVNPDMRHEESFLSLVEALGPTLRTTLQPSRGGHIEVGDAELRQARHQFRKLFSPKAKRRNAGLPVNELLEMDLRLPVAGSSGQSGQREDTQV